MGSVRHRGRHPRRHRLCGASGRPATLSRSAHTTCRNRCTAGRDGRTTRWRDGFDASRRDERSSFSRRRCRVCAMGAFPAHDRSRPARDAVPAMGGNDLTGFDCSGFVRYVFAQFGHQLPREVQAQFKAGRRHRSRRDSSRRSRVLRDRQQGCFARRDCPGQRRIRPRPEFTGRCADRALYGRVLGETMDWSASGGLTGQAAQYRPLRTRCRDDCGRNWRMARSSSVNRVATRGSFSGSMRHSSAPGANGWGVTISM